MVDNRRVFLIHGRNRQARQAVIEFLASLEIIVMQWSDARSLANRANNEASPSLLQIIRAGMAECQCVVALFTPDDHAYLREDLRQVGDEEWERKLTGQPRQNVLFEAGAAFALYPERSVIVEVGKVRPASDLAGIDRIRLDSKDSRNKFRQAVIDAGCSVGGDSKYLEAGEFVERLEARCQRWIDSDYSWKQLLSESELEGVSTQQLNQDDEFIGAYVLISAVQHGYSVPSWLCVNLHNKAAVHALLDTVVGSPHVRPRMRAARALEAVDSDLLAEGTARLEEVRDGIPLSAWSLINAVRENSVSRLVKENNAAGLTLADWQIAELLSQFKDYPSRQVIRLLDRYGSCSS